MYYIEVEYLEKLARVVSAAVTAYSNAPDDSSKQQALFKANFIKNFASDVFFLVDHNGQEAFYSRYANYILRSMSEQLIEFSYILKNPHLMNEYMGEEIPSKLHKELSQCSRHKVADLKIFGSKRFNPVRTSVSQMAGNINEKHSLIADVLTIYDIYAILSERCHNSYFSALLDDYAKVHFTSCDIGLTEEQVHFCNALILSALTEFDK